MRYVVLIARLLLGAPFVVFGLNTYLWAVYDKAFMDPPAVMPYAASTFMQAMTDTAFMHPLRGAVELLGGLMVLTGLWAPLGLAILAPVVVHIVLYHYYLDPQGMVIAYVILALEIFLALAYGKAFRTMLTPLAAARWDRKPEGE